MKNRYLRAAKRRASTIPFFFLLVGDPAFCLRWATSKPSLPRHSQALRMDTVRLLTFGLVLLACFAHCPLTVGMMISARGFPRASCFRVLPVSGFSFPTNDALSSDEDTIYLAWRSCPYVPALGGALKHPTRVEGRCACAGCFPHPISKKPTENIIMCYLLYFGRDTPCAGVPAIICWRLGMLSHIGPFFCWLAAPRPNVWIFALCGWDTISSGRSTAASNQKQKPLYHLKYNTLEFAVSAAGAQNKGKFTPHLPGPWTFANPTTPRASKL